MSDNITARQQAKAAARDPKERPEDFKDILRRWTTQQLRDAGGLPGGNLPGMERKKTVKYVAQMKDWLRTGSRAGSDVLAEPREKALELNALIPFHDGNTANSKWTAFTHSVLRPWEVLNPRPSKQPGSDDLPSADLDTNDLLALLARDGSSNSDESFSESKSDSSRGPTPVDQQLLSQRQSSSGSSVPPELTRGVSELMAELVPVQPAPPPANPFSLTRGMTEISALLEQPRPDPVVDEPQQDDVDEEDDGLSDVEEEDGAEMPAAAPPNNHLLPDSAAVFDPVTPSAAPPFSLTRGMSEIDANLSELPTPGSTALDFEGEGMLRLPPSGTGATALAPPPLVSPTGRVSPAKRSFSDLLAPALEELEQRATVAERPSSAQRIRDNLASLYQIAEEEDTAAPNYRSLAGTAAAGVTAAAAAGGGAAPPATYRSLSSVVGGLSVLTPAAEDHDEAGQQRPVSPSAAQVGSKLGALRLSLSPASSAGSLHAGF